MKNRVTKKWSFSFPLWNLYFTWKEQSLLFILVVIGVIIRIINALHTPLWRDEIYIFFTAHNNSLWNLITQQHWDTAHPPLHSIFVHFWQMISIQPLWLRLPSIFVTFFILYILPLIAIRVFPENKFLPFVFVFLYSISHSQISLNMVARPYPFVLVLNLLSLWILLDFLVSNKGVYPTIIIFGAINLLAIFIDYSTVWLFCVYLFFYIIYFLTRNTKVSKIKIRLFYLFLFTAILSLSIIPFLFGNLKNSLHLERVIPSVRPDKDLIKESDYLYLYIDRKNRKIITYNRNLESTKSVRLSYDPFPNSVAYIGLNLSPWSILNLRHFDLCPINKNIVNIREIFESCKIHKTTLTPNMYKFTPFLPRVLSYVINNQFFLFNFHRTRWETSLFDEKIQFTPKDNILISVNLVSIHTQSPSGISIFGKKQKDNINWWKDITRLTIFSQEGSYTANYYDGHSPTPSKVSGSGGILEKFKRDIRFFVGMPDGINTLVLYPLAIIFMILVQIPLIWEFITRKNYQSLLISLLFFIPLILSLSISYYYVPIFVGRNIHYVNFSYLFGLAFVISIFFNNKSFFYKLCGIFTLCVPIYFFVSAFPYLHYVDKPYDMNTIMKKVFSSTNKERIIILGNNDHYLPLLQYGYLIGGYEQQLYVYLKESFNDKKIIFDSVKNDLEIFFIKFGENKHQTGVEFNEIITNSKCKVQVTDIPYVYLSKCR